MNSFFAAVTYVDDLIGEVLEAVVDNELDENTIIALIGDHGWTLGENQVRIPILFFIHVLCTYDYRKFSTVLVNSFGT